MIKRLYLFLLLLAICSNVWAEVGRLSFDKITKKNGLTHNRVQAILKSSEGFIWIGTLEGLNRYDGAKVSTFLHDATKSNSISDNLVSSLYEDEDSVLWIGTGSGGLNKYDKNTGKFTSYLPNSKENKSGGNDVRSISPDSDGYLWLGLYGGGISRFDKRTGKFINYIHQSENPNSLNLDNIYSVLSDGQYVWVATSDNGLDRFDKVSGLFTHYTHSPKIGSLSSNSVFALFKDSNNNIWIGTGDGLNRYDTKQDAFITYKHLEHNKNSLSNNIVVNISQDSFGRLWIATRNGLSCLNNPATNKEYFTNYYKNAGDISSLGADDLLTTYIDNTNILWIGTFNNGVNKAFLSEKPFIQFSNDQHDSTSLSKNIIRSIFEDKDGNLWVGTEEGGLNLKRAGSQSFERFDNASITPNQVSAGQDSDGNMWFGSWRGGVSRLSYNDIKSPKGKFKTYLHNPHDSTSILSNIVQDIFLDREGRLWLGTEDGLSLYNKLTDSFISFTESKVVPNSLSDNRIQSNTIFQDTDGTIWIGTWNGLNKMVENRTDSTKTIEGIKLPPHSIRFRSFLNNPSNPNSIGSNKVISITADKTGYLWIGTYGSGFYRFDKGTDRFKSFSEKDGLVDNVVYSILADDENNLWLSTNDGLSCFSIQTSTFRNFDESDGLLSNYFYYGASFKFKNGNLAFGSTGGLTIFNPSTIVENKIVPPVLISDFLINNIPVNYDVEGAPIKVPIWNTREITLPYSKNILTFEFVALNYIHSDKNKYAYKLEGFNDEWIAIGTKKSASYTNLSPGTYTFHVKGSNNNDVWNEVGASIKITITPPFWGTWWFITLVILALIALILLIFYLRLRKIRMQRIILKKLVESKTQELHAANSVLYNLNKELTEVNTLLEETNEEMSEQKEQLLFQSDEILSKSEEILLQNRLLETHQNHLEDLVYSRTEELVAAKEKAEESERLKAAFLANMSHELRTPLNAIVGFSGLIMMEGNSRDELELYYKQISDNTDALLLLIDDILDLSRIEAKQTDKIDKLFNISELLKGIYTHWHANQGNADREIIYNDGINNPNLQIFSDENKIRQIVNNLMGNGCKFTEKGTVELGLEESDESYIIYVKDNGIGITKKNSAIIFDYFRKVEGDNSKFYRGTGLGLAISKRLAELLGGELWVESKINVGSTFYFSLPKKFVVNS